MSKQEAPRENQARQPYKVPAEFASVTIHFLYYGLSEKGHYPSVKEYFREKQYALTADLIKEGFTPEQIEKAVDSGVVRVAPVFKKRVTDFYWTKEAEKSLNKMAELAAKNCGGDGTDFNVPAFGDIASLGGIFESQQIALAALAYAAHKNLVAETDMDRGIGIGPLFINKANPVASLFVSSEEVK